MKLGGNTIIRPFVRLLADEGIFILCWTWGLNERGEENDRR